MKRILSLSLLILLMACEGENDLVKKRAELEEKKKELAELEKEIRKLENQVAELDTTKIVKELTPVSVTEIQIKPFEHFTQLTGTVTSRENVSISAEASGQVLEIVSAEGKKVSAGQVLVRLENDAVRNQLAEVQSAFDLAETTYKKRKRLWDQQIGSEIEYLQAKSSYEGLRNKLEQIRSLYNKSFIKSPINGTVDNISVNKGELVSPGMPIARVVDLDKVVVEADISEEYLMSVKKGDTVVVEIPALDISRRVPVTFVGQVINPENRSFTVKINLDNSDKSIKPNVLANIVLRDYSNLRSVTVPSIAIKKDLKGDFVYVVEQDNEKDVVRKRHVITGKSSSDYTEILEGLNEGDKLITSGFNQVTAGAEVNVK